MQLRVALLLGLSGVCLGLRVSPKQASLRSGGPASRKELVSGIGAALGLVAAAGLPSTAAAEGAGAVPTKISGQYYFPTARYRYLPRILSTWNSITIDGAAAMAQDPVDWEAMDAVYKRVDDITTALPLFADAIEGARSSKRKKKSGLQVTLLKQGEEYNKTAKALEKALKKKDAKATPKTVADTEAALLTYRQTASIDGEDGGLVEVPENMKKYVSVFKGMPTEQLNKNAKSAQATMQPVSN